MSTMNISLPESLKAYVDQQVEAGHYGTSSEFVRELIRRDQERTRLRAMLLQGAASPPVGFFDEAYFAALQDSIHKRAGK